MTEGDLTQAELFDVFSNARRRMAVRYLTERDGTCDLAPLVEQVAAWENGVSPDEVTRTQRRRVYISLYQTHLPMLEDHGIVDWDPDGHAIDLLPSETAFEPYLDRHPDESRDWHHAYATLAVAGVVALALAWFSVGPLSASLAPHLGLAVTGTFLVAAVVQRSARTAGSLVPVPQ